MLLGVDQRFGLVAERQNLAAAKRQRPACPAAVGFHMAWPWICLWTTLHERALAHVLAPVLAPVADQIMLLYSAATPAFSVPHKNYKNAHPTWTIALH